MDTYHIPLNTIGVAASSKSKDPDSDMSEDRGDRLPVIEVLAEIASSMSSDADTEQMLMRFLEIMVRISSARAGAVRVLTADGAHLRMVGSMGLSPALVEKERYVPLECGICGKATLSQASCLWVTCSEEEATASSCASIFPRISSSCSFKRS